MTDVSENIRKFRIKNGLSQAELARKLHLTPQSISKWERGVSEPELKFLCKLSLIFNVTTDELLGVYHIDNSEHFFIGIDGGGTKTEFVLFSSSGRIIGRMVLSGSNPNACGTEASFFVLKKGIDSLVNPGNRCVDAIFGGIAGCGSGDNAEKITEMLKRSYPDTNISITSDIENVVGSVSSVSDCIAVICGTGNIVYAKKNNVYHRFGGWGYLLDDAGSGFTIGRDAMRAVLAEKDGIGEKTMLTNILEKKLGGKLWEKISLIYAKGTEYIASFTEDVFDAYDKKDKVAKRILEENFSYIAQLINHAYKKYNCNATVILSGGITKKKTVMTDFFKGRVDSNINLIFPDMPQIYGACRNCCKAYSEPAKDFEGNFKSDYFKIIKEGNNNA